MTFSIRSFDQLFDEDFNLMKDWLSGHDWPEEALLSKALLPKNGGLVAIDSNKVPVGVIFVYQTDSAYQVLGWPVVDPCLKNRKEVLSFLVERAIIFARARNPEGLIYAPVKHPSVAEVLKEKKFVLGDGNVSDFMFGLREVA